ncbi:MAG TPA: MFS transporter [Thermomicrobiales bacterium]|nr:MFS transporter [Thermomicrobiales bacterium]
MTGFRSFLRTPVGYGTILLATATFFVGFAMAAQQNIVSNYFENEIGLKGPEFGYITAIREVPGFLLIFVAALFYRLSLARLTALALLVLTIGYGFFGFSSSFWTVAPWVIISSVGYHTWLQTQSALGLSLTTEKRAGWILGRVSAVNQAGTMIAMALVLLTFEFNILSYRGTFILCGLAALIGAIAIFRFPHLHNGKVLEVKASRPPIVLKRDYRLYYALSVLDGARQQIFFSFGLWVLVNTYHLTVPQISVVLLVVAVIAIVAGPRIGKLIDLYGEKTILGFVNIGYVIALLGYALASNASFAVSFYVIYTFIAPLSAMGATVYLRKIATASDLAPSLAMGLTMQHAAAIVVPVVTGFILNYVGYQIPFLVGGCFAILGLFLTRRLDSDNQKSEGRRAEELRLSTAAEAA